MRSKSLITLCLWQVSVNGASYYKKGGVGDKEKLGGSGRPAARNNEPKEHRWSSFSALKNTALNPTTLTFIPFSSPPTSSPKPSPSPSIQPTTPTSAPSLSPSSNPTIPTFAPTETVAPTPAPSTTPTIETMSPTKSSFPSSAPSATQSPSSSPSLVPTFSSDQPSQIPSAAPTGVIPTNFPSDSPRPSPSPSSTPTITAAPTISPLPTTSTPTFSPSVSPSFFPTETMAPSPAPSLSKQPSSLSSLAPSKSPSPTPPCIYAIPGKDSSGKTIITVQLHYSNLDARTREFVENCENPLDPECPITDLTPKSSDWFGFYPCSAREGSFAFNVEPRAWAYTCYTDNCRRGPTATSEATIIFADETAPKFGTEGLHQHVSTLPAGCYTVLLNRINGYAAAPYYNICAGNDFTIE
mmetsp:Transcript_20795/g.30782  ORF Transcript_20795/g.30782 Transcript_20795/m.30782 type:complete len:411 (+) Transcript_20795:51-1283(+)